MIIGCNLLQKAARDLLHTFSANIRLELLGGRFRLSDKAVGITSQGCMHCYMMPLNALVLVVHQCPVSQSGACPLGHPKVPCPPSLVAIIKYHQRLAK